MCGIVGQFCHQDLYPKENSSLFLEKISHRGEAQFQNEIYEQKGYSLGANRLAITSEEKESQPFYSHNQNTYVVLNGEIYNYQVLIDKYKLPFSRNDGEALANLLEYKGINIIEELDGIFAFIALKKHEKKAYIALDCIGVKPLYYALVNKGFIFASEIKALAFYEEIKEIKEVNIGSIIEIEWNSQKNPFIAQSSEYFSLTHLSHTEPLNTENFLPLLEASVKQQVASDQPIGVYLSGGIDSSTIYALARKYHTNIVPLILSSKDDEKGDLDGTFALRLAQYFGDEPILDYIDKEEMLFEHIPRIIAMTEGFEPNLIKQSSASYFIARLAQKAKVKIVLTGEGADELFCGYPDFQNNSDWRALRVAFMQDLHHTQLKRVDRTSMFFTTEARVPFLTPDIISATLNQNKKSYFINEKYNKVILRESTKELLPKWIRLRKKVVLSEGVGLKGNNLQSGLFTEIIKNKISDREYNNIKLKFPLWGIKSKEEAYYFQIFHRLGYSKATFLQKRITANKIHTKM